MDYRRVVIVLAVLATMLGTGATAAEKLPLTGSQLERWQAAQNLPLQRALRTEIHSQLGGERGILVTGPLWLDAPTNHKYYPWYVHNRIVCPSRSMLGTLVDALYQAGKLTSAGRGKLDDITKPRNWEDDWAIACQYNGDTIVFVTVQHTRYLLWARGTLLDRTLDVSRKAMGTYAKRVARYLFKRDLGSPDATPPSAADCELPARFDLFPDRPPYVIDGYQNYKDLFAQHAPLYTDFAAGVLTFVPSDSLLDALAARAPDSAFPNKAAPMLQAEYRDFLDRGGRPAVMQTLTSAGFDTLSAGEYFFAVGLNGTVRFAQELLREEVTRVEEETGRKAPRANHAFLFPGEPVLTAGTFFVERDSLPRITAVNARSERYFYSNLSPSVKDDIASGSNVYFLTLGHLFEKLDSLGIACQGVNLSKF